jgi:hypothetical protein
MRSGSGTLVAGGSIRSGSVGTRRRSRAVQLSPGDIELPNRIFAGHPAPSRPVDAAEQLDASRAYAAGAPSLLSNCSPMDGRAGRTQLRLEAWVLVAAPLTIPALATGRAGLRDRPDEIRTKPGATSRVPAELE